MPHLMSACSACLLQSPKPGAAHGQQELPRNVNTRAGTRSRCPWQPGGSRAARPGRACRCACSGGRWGQSVVPDAPTTTTLSAAWLQSSGDSPYTVFAVASPSTSVCESAVVTATEGGAPSLTLRSLPARTLGSRPPRAGAGVAPHQGAPVGVQGVPDTRHSIAGMAGCGRAALGVLGRTLCQPQVAVCPRGARRAGSPFSMAGATACSAERRRLNVQSRLLPGASTSCSVAAQAAGVHGVRRGALHSLHKGCMEVRERADR
jgi:hypothetical protein